jgi:hypothetical protein
VNVAGNAGVTLVELAVSMAVTLILAGALLPLVTMVRTTAAAQAEASDLQQRLRAALHVLADDLVNAGAGLDRTSMAGPLVRAVPPVVPYRRGQVADDARAGIFFRPDVLSLVYVGSSVPQAEVETAVDLGGRLRVDLRPNCGALAPIAVCGFVERMRVIILEPSGAHDLLTVEAVAGAALELSYRGQLSSSYARGTAVLAVAVTRSYAMRLDPESGIPQLTQYDGFLTERPVADHVVGLRFEYLGDPEPPRLRPGADPGATPPPWTTYGPPPPPVGTVDASTSWGAGENCTFVVRDGRHEPRLDALGPPGDLVPLPPGLFGDGPWCPDGSVPGPFDADLLRVRQVRIRIRVETQARAMRGARGAFFWRAGAASRAAALLPDQEAVLDIVPRNLAAGH